MFGCPLHLQDGSEQVLLAMSALSEQGIAEVKTAACDRLLTARVEMKVQVRSGGCLFSTTCFWTFFCRLAAVAMVVVVVVVAA